MLGFLFVFRQGVNPRPHGHTYAGLAVQEEHSLAKQIDIYQIGDLTVKMRTTCMYNILDQMDPF